jgi:hypothetical protein
MRVFSLCATLLIACVAFAQRPIEVYGPAYGPYVPLVTTPQVSLSTVSANPVGARNATYGLVSGARNSTLEIINGNTSSTLRNRCGIRVVVLHLSRSLRSRCTYVTFVATNA